MQLLISGSIQAPDGHEGITAILLVLDTERSEIVHRCEYVPEPPLNVPGMKIQFTGYCFLNGSLFVCSHNQILVFDDWPARKPSRSISIKGFNDLHHCRPYRGGLVVSNTGLETVDHISVGGELIQRWDVIKHLPGARTIDPEKDYRLIPDTKPHLAHNNHIFEYAGNLWASQLKQSNAICVTDPARSPLELSVGMPHDGEIMNGKIVFTTTNGHLVFFDVEDPTRREIVSLIELTPGFNQLGWCRAVCPVAGHPNQYFVGFSALRRSKWKDFGYWIKYGHDMPKSHIALYDLADRTRLTSWNIGEGVGYQIFQVEPLPKELEV